MKIRTSTFGWVSVAFLVSPAFGATLQVGPGKTYAKPCAAFAAAAAGDTIEIDAAGNGTYDGDVCAIGPAGLTIRGVNGRAHVDAAGNNAQGKATWVVQGDGTTIENMELSGASVPDLNGAGIRAEGENLTVRGSYFHDNQEGILGGAGELLIETSEFSRNGNCIDPAGCAHNMYISGSVTKFTLRYSYTHLVTDGHLVKSRAQTNYILYNRITGEDGTDSYEINLPNAGTSYVIGNLIEQGPNTANSAILDYGSEGATNPGNDLYVINNTFVNNRGGGGTFVSIAGGVSTPAVVKNNVFFGPGTAISQGSAVASNNFTGDPLLVDEANYDYHLLPASPCVDAGVDPGQGASFSLLPVAEYVHGAAWTPRTSVGAIDIGAYELGNPGIPDGGTAGAPGSGGGNAGGAASASGGSAGSTAGGGARNGSGGGSNGGMASGAGGSGANGAAGGAGRVGSSSDAGATRAPSSGDKGGCGCRAAGSRGGGAPAALLTLLGVALVVRRRRARPATR